MAPMAHNKIHTLEGGVQSPARSGFLVLLSCRLRCTRCPGLFLPLNSAKIAPTSGFCTWPEKLSPQIFSRLDLCSNVTPLKSSNIPTYTPLHTIWFYYICNSHQCLALLFTCLSISALKHLKARTLFTLPSQCRG